MSIDAMKMALEALEGLRDLFYQDTIEALRAAIEAAEKVEPVAIYEGKEGEYGYETITLYEDIPVGVELFTTPQPAIDDVCKNDAARWNFVMTTEPYALNLWNALPKNIYQQERHLNNAIDQAMLPAAPSSVLRLRSGGT